MLEAAGARASTARASRQKSRAARVTSAQR
jgi:hypothetical protein